MAMSKSGKAAVVLCLMLCLVAASPARAEEFEGVKDGYYLGALFAYNGMSGDFEDLGLIFEEGDLDDETVDGDVVFVPDVDNGAGFGVVLGRRFDKLSFELGYQRTAHDTFFDDSDAAYNVVDLNVKIDVFAADRLRPYVLLGGGFSWLTIEDNTLEPDDTLDDTDFSGFCLNAGVGVAYYFDPQWALLAGLIHRWNWFTHVDDGRLDPDIEERALGFTVGLAYTF